MVRLELPLRLTAPRLVVTLGAGSAASGSAWAATPVAGVTLKPALPETWSPPTMRTAEAVTLALPLRWAAYAEVESTTSQPGMLTDELPERFSAELPEPLMR